MFKIVHFIRHTIGLDGAVFFNSLARIIQGIGGVVSIVFITLFLSKEEQGFFFTFGSILSMQVFFELGFSGIITQFSSKYFAKLQWDGYGITGDVESLSRLSSLLRISIKWFVIIAFIVFIFLSIVGYFFFNVEDKTDVNWEMPWFFTCFSTSALLLITPIISYLEGLGKTKFVGIIRFVQYSAQTIFLFMFLWLDTKLYARSFATILSVLIIVMILYFSENKRTLSFLWKRESVFKVNYIKEIFPYQWKISLSWLSGYLIYQLFNPIVFAFDGASAAGKIGVTLAVVGAFFTLSMTWINTKIPLLARLVANDNFIELDKTFGKVFLQSFFICFLGQVFFLLVLVVFKYFNIQFVDRFLDLKYILLLSFATLVNQVISSYAVYIRSHLKEPLTYMSLTVGILIALFSILFGKLYGVKGVVIVYTFVMTFISLPWTYYIYIKFKKRIYI